MAHLVSIKFKKRDVRLKDVPKFYQELEENTLSVGLHKEQGKHNVEKGFWNEFGVAPFILSKPMKKRLADGSYTTLTEGTVLHIPARPFTRLYLYPERLQRVLNEYKNSYELALKNGLKPPKQSAKKVLNDVGIIAKNEMYDIILSKTLLPNAPLTVAIKGFDFPLFKIGKMVNAIKHKVRKK